MNKKHYRLGLRFIFFLLAFAVAFFLMTFLIDRNPSIDYESMFIKIGILAPVCALFYIILVERGSKIVD